MGQAAASPSAQIVRPSTCFLLDIGVRYGKRGDYMENDVRELKKHINFALVPAAFNESIHHVHHPSGSLSARRALSARFVFVELQQRC